LSFDHDKVIREETNIDRVVNIHNHDLLNRLNVEFFQRSPICKFLFERIYI